VSAARAAPRRVWVVGCSGAGKTTFARRLAARIGAAHVEIDALFHQANWTETPRDVLRARVAERIAHAAWVVDGNYRKALEDLVLEAADTVVWIDPPRRVVMTSVVRRTLGRMWRKTELWNGNRERWRNLFDPRPAENIVLWAWTQFGAYRRGYAALAASPRAGQTWHRFRSRADADAWLAALPGSTAAAEAGGSSSDAARS